MKKILFKRAVGEKIATATESLMKNADQLYENYFEQFHKEFLEKQRQVEAKLEAERKRPVYEVVVIEVIIHGPFRIDHGKQHIIGASLTHAEAHEFRRQVVELFPGKELAVQDSTINHTPSQLQLIQAMGRMMRNSTFGTSGSTYAQPVAQQNGVFIIDTETTGL